MQGHSFVTDVLSLPLDSYDLVLGIQWLVELGDIRWNFKELQMKFMIGISECVLRGKLNKNPILTVSSDRMEKVLAKQDQLALLQCFELEVRSDTREKIQGQDTLASELQAVLEEFADVF